MNPLVIGIIIVVGFLTAVILLAIYNSSQEPILSTQKTWVSNSIKVTDSNFTINYNITGGQLFKAEFGCRTQDIMLSLTTTSNGSITVQIPKVLINSNTPINKEKELKCKSKRSDVSYIDDAFFVIVDTHAVRRFTETKTSIDRTFTIPFKSGTKEIGIFGLK